MTHFVRTIGRITCPAFAESRGSIAFGVLQSSTRFQVHECHRFLSANVSSVPSTGHG
jgi:hypothetical protein